MQNLNSRISRAILSIALALWFSAAHALAVPPLEPTPTQGRVAHLSALLLGKYHYLRNTLDDAASGKILESYLKSLDRERLFFLQSDIDQITAAARSQLDDAILEEDMTIPFHIYNLYRQRAVERITYARSLLAKGFDFSKDESYEYTREKSHWAASKAEIDDLWRKRVKNDWLRLKLAGKGDKEIVAVLGKRYASLLGNVTKLKGDDAFQTFMDSYTTSIDPHTDYFGVRASNEFDISMKLSLFGIGALLQDRDDYVTIRELVAGGPAALSGKLNVGDRIMAVGQGKKGAMAEVTGLRLDDAVAMIRGKENTVVVLDVLPVGAGPDAEHKQIALVRKKITLDKQAAKKSVIEVKDGGAVRRIGVIQLPGFYQDFGAREKGDPNFKSATRDVSRILTEFKQEKIDSVLIDLRNNGGGSLDEAVELTGLFIGKGAVVQQRDANDKVSVAESKQDAVWSGPMGVLINRGSASASEIFVAAIQDYGRGVVIGSPSFGKGTVQSLLDLDKFSENKKPQYGELKLTIAQFFRINGGTTQLRGVVPDISFPSSVSAEDFGESSYPNALPWSQIPAAKYTPEGNLSAIVPQLEKLHGARIKGDKDFRYLQEDLDELNEWRAKNRISLNEAERRKERDDREAKRKQRELDKSTDEAGTEKDDFVFRDDGLQSSERSLAEDIALEKARKDAKDVLLNEAAHILSDEIPLLH
ncbi:MAG: carboxy terminal-processing peptidase [Gallionellaceae bacterium]|jgi:carboxyl-terminal processing protease|nr:carboxy terminal-processing peptidase [Gallionellaceae bacterium]